MVFATIVDAATTAAADAAANVFVIVVVVVATASAYCHRPTTANNWTFHLAMNFQTPLQPNVWLMWVSCAHFNRSICANAHLALLHSDKFLKAREKERVAAMNEHAGRHREGMNETEI